MATASKKSTFRVQPRSTRTKVSGRFIQAMKSVSGKNVRIPASANGKASKG